MPAPRVTAASTLAALIFDVDGTLADTEHAHLEAFNEAFAECGLPWRWSVPEYTRLLLVSGGKERILHYWRSIDPEAAQAPEAPARVAEIHRIKTRIYESKVADGQVPLRPGIARLIEEARRARLQLAIATTTTPANIDALLRKPFGPQWRSMFAAIGDASTSPVKKPDPQVYLDVLAALKVLAYEAIAFEDSENGLRAASAAGVSCICTPTAFTSHHDLSQALVVVPHLGDPEQPLAQPLPGLDQPYVTLETVERWHRGVLFEAG
ncbi:MAG: HAD-IA family hydrolase [Casimicrobiaceae bacterium]|nr:HAD-IA family hydrolase [Casimicrobiaceae bacterium]MCX8097938.1 HAD-IA family hydrolase [Casimicrobiaceae bacterium]MDW8312879.1 HAD-IA family hydrolase [Burkholderiales bacterium]